MTQKENQKMSDDLVGRLEAKTATLTERNRVLEDHVHSLLRIILEADRVRERQWPKP